MRRAMIRALAATLACFGASAAQADTIMIDDFTSGALQYYLTSSPAYLSETHVQTGLADVLGGERDSVCTITGYLVFNAHVVLGATTGTGSLSVNDDYGISSLLELTYPDLDGAQLTGSGLQVEFTTSDLAGATLTFSATAANSHTGSASQTGTTGLMTYFFPYSSFGGALTPTDFTDVGLDSLVFSVQSMPSQDYSLEAIKSTDVPEPMTMSLMLLGLGAMGACIRKRRMT